MLQNAPSAAYHTADLLTSAFDFLAIWLPLDENEYKPDHINKALILFEDRKVGNSENSVDFGAIPIP